MTSRHFHLIMVFAALTGFNINLHAQIPQVVLDDNLISDFTKSDEFNGSSLDTNKWFYIDACNDTDSIKHGFNWGGGEFCRPQNVSVGGGNLVLKVEYNPDSLDTLSPCLHHHSYPFYSGGIMSALKKGAGDLGDIGNFSFGYYEMRAKLPGYYDSQHQPVGSGFMPTFWIYYQHWNNGCVDKHDEVDILEPDPYQYYDAKTNVAGWHDELQDTCGAKKIGQKYFESSTPLFEDFHKYGMELLPDKIVFFFDDEPFYSVDANASPEILHSLDMSPYLCVVINVQMGGFLRPGPPPDAPIPQRMYVDYFRYYSMAEDAMNMNVALQNSPNPVTGATEISCNIAPGTQQAALNIYSVTGALVKSFPLTEKGKSILTIFPSELQPGIYLYSLLTDGKSSQTRKMIVIK
jgi:beta-glucanase (GH16 family)